MHTTMKLAVASGKGGTGKTTVAVSLALTAAAAGKSVQYLDCDVEEPNGHIFLKPQIQSQIQVTVPIPDVIGQQCDGCGVCADICAYNAIAVVRQKVLIFPELCRGCGACSLFCPRAALVEKRRPVGTVEIGAGSGIGFIRGVLSIGQIMSPAVIAAVKDAGGGHEILLLDCPPGTSCPVIESVRDADAVLLVTEPTPFGLHDLTLAVEMTRALGKPFCVALNRYDLGDDKTVAYCRKQDIPIMLILADDRRVAEAYARGQALTEALPSYIPAFEAAWEWLWNWQPVSDQDRESVAEAGPERATTS